MYLNPTGGGKDSLFSHYTGGGKDSVLSNPTGGGKDSLFFIPHRRGKDSLCSPLVGGDPLSTLSWCIYPRSSSETIKPSSGKQAKIVPASMENTAHRSILNLIAEGYKLPFGEHPTLSRTPYITSGYADFNRQSALSTAIQDLLLKGAVDTIQKPDSLGFYSRLFLVPKPGNHWRPVIDLSCLNKFLAIPKFKMETPESIRAPLRKNE